MFTAKTKYVNTITESPFNLESVQVNREVPSLRYIIGSLLSPKMAVPAQMLKVFFPEDITVTTH